MVLGLRSLGLAGKNQGAGITGLLPTTIQKQMEKEMASEKETVFM